MAIGEIGLDYHYETPSRDCQRQWLACQLRLAVEQQLPVILHDRDAHEDTLKLLRQYRPQGVVHCFSGSVEMARELVRLGFYIGLGGAVTFKNARRAPLVAAAVPADRLLLETDAPYMTPVPSGENGTGRIISPIPPPVSPNSAAFLRRAVLSRPRKMPAAVLYRKQRMNRVYAKGLSEKTFSGRLSSITVTANVFTSGLTNDPLDF